MPDRIEIVRKAVERWREQLVDTSGNNPLLKFRVLTTGTLDLTPDNGNGLDNTEMDHLLKGRTVRLNRLFSPDGFGDAFRRVSAIRRNARSDLEEKGIDTLFAAIGLATWKVELGVTPPNAPVLLAPLEIKPVGKKGFSLKISGDIRLNPVLTYILERDHGVDTKPISQRIAVAQDADDPLAAFASYDRLRRGWLRDIESSWSDWMEQSVKAIRHHTISWSIWSAWLERQAATGWHIKPCMAVGIFRYASQAMVEDLKEHYEHFAGNDLVAAIAGDPGAQDALKAAIRDPGPEPDQPDHDPSRAEFLVLDADSSQHMAINRVLGGESLVIQGPPGTGKSQTIANLIATLMAHDKRVLFVAEKRAAIEAVTKRLAADDVDLADLVMDCHGGIRGEQLAQALKKGLAMAKGASPIADHNLQQRLDDRRRLLAEHHAALHKQRDPWGICVFHLQERLLDIPRDAHTTARLSDAANRITADRFKDLKGAIGEWVKRGGYDFASDHPEWSRSTVTTSSEAHVASGLASNLSETYLPEARDAIFDALDAARLTRPHTVAEWQDLLQLVSGVERILTRCQPEVYRLDHTALRESLTVGIGMANRVIVQLSMQASDERREVHDLAARIAALLPEACEVLFTALDEVGLTRTQTISEWSGMVDLLSDVQKMQDQCPADIYRRTRVERKKMLPPEASGIMSILNSIFSREYRAEREVRDDMLQEMDRHDEKWAQWSTDGLHPCLPANLGGVKERITALADMVARLQRLVTTDTLAGVEHDELLQVLSRVNEYWNAREALLAALREPEDLSGPDAFGLLDEVEGQIEEWGEQMGSGEPRVPDGLDAARERVRTLAAALANLGAIIKDDGLAEWDAKDLTELLERLASTESRTAARRLPHVRELEERFREAGITAVLKRVGKGIPPKHAASAIEHAWLSRVVDIIEFQGIPLDAFNGDDHSKTRDEFIEFDQQHIQSNPERVKRSVVKAADSALFQHLSEKKIVIHEANKKSKLKPVRRLFREAPNVLTALRPCWTMSPILAAEMIPPDVNRFPDRSLFDVVIFDEASQIQPAEAIGSLARAPQAVIAGDNKQLPPTTFFFPTDDDDEDGQDALDTKDGDATTSQPASEGMESILDTALSIPLRDQMLKWHYRSRDARLIAFSNKYLYRSALTVFPGTISTPSPIVHQRVPFPVPDISKSGTASNPLEVERVVELVIDHARMRPQESLGVIAFGQAHATAIENGVAKHLEGESLLADFFNDSNDERFFVKNIERVQGDEREAIILSVGYCGRRRDGRLAHRFGPINQKGGERRLNVAVTRARSRLTLVSSFGHHDMTPGLKAEGVELLRKYLEFAASGGASLGAGGTDVPLNPFELSVADGLKSRGIEFIPQYGVSGYRIDFACHYPGQPGRMVLAIEADGASIHSRTTVRERDRLRQQVLEGMGWSFHRIWSTNWFRDREAELDKAVRAYKEAVEKADDEPGTTSS